MVNRGTGVAGVVRVVGIGQLDIVHLGLAEHIRVNLASNKFCLIVHIDCRTTVNGDRIASLILCSFEVFEGNSERIRAFPRDIGRTVVSGIYD